MLKYTIKDTETMIDVFGTIAENFNNPSEIYQEMLKIADYPIPVLREFLKCMEVLSKQNQDDLSKNYMGTVGYITIRLNLVNV